MRILDKGGVALDFAALGFEDDTLKAFLDVLRAAARHPARHRPDRLAARRRRSTPRSTALNTARRQDPHRRGPGRIPDAPASTRSRSSRRSASTFANALRSIVRQDPDIIMIGEIRDLETAQIAMQSALTGHLVLSTLHTNDAAGDGHPPARHGRRGLSADVDRHRHPRAAPRAHAVRAVQGAVHRAAGGGRADGPAPLRAARARSRSITPRAAAQCANTGYIGPHQHHGDAADDRSAAHARHAARQRRPSCAPRRSARAWCTMYEDGLRKALEGRDDVRGSAARHARGLTAAPLDAALPLRAVSPPPASRRPASSTPPTSRRSSIACATRA